MSMSEEETQPKKSGIITLVGRSNVGKSTLLNALIGFKMAPVSPRAQTTRWALRGVLDDERGQAVFVDTPGLFIDTPDALTRAVNKQVEQNINGIDLLLYVVDPTREIGQEERRLLGMVRNIKKKVLVINKIDTGKPKYLFDYEQLGEDEEFLHTVKISAKTGAHLKSLLNIVFNELPEGDAMYQYEERDPGTFAFKQWVSEVIREKVFHHVHQEIPYSTHVVIDDVGKRDDGMLEIYARLLTDTERYRPMLIGKNGHKIKEIGTASRKELELILQKKVFLKLDVETDPHWLESIS